MIIYIIKAGLFLLVCALLPTNGDVISETNYEGGDCKEGPNTYTSSYVINVIDDIVCTTIFKEEGNEIHFKTHYDRK
jgi:hypothetical protein